MTKVSAAMKRGPRQTRNTLWLILVLLDAYGALPAIAAMRDYKDYQSWDRDDNGYLSAREFSGYIYGVADQDGDGFVNQAEWSRYTGSWYDPFQARQQYFPAYDANKDGYLQEDEFFISLADSGMFAAWDYDRNGYLDQNEWGEGIAAHQRRPGNQDKEEKIVITGDE